MLNQLPIRIYTAEQFLTLVYSLNGAEHVFADSTIETVWVDTTSTKSNIYFDARRHTLEVRMDNDAFIGPDQVNFDKAYNLLVARGFLLSK